MSQENPIEERPVRRLMTQENVQEFMSLIRSENAITAYIMIFGFSSVVLVGFLRAFYPFILAWQFVLIFLGMYSVITLLIIIINIARVLGPKLYNDWFKTLPKK